MKKQAKTEVLKFRVTPKEKEIITEKALSSYRTLSIYLRDCALDKKINVVNGAENIANELRRIGNNLNQITREINAGYVSAVDFRELKEEVKIVWQSLNSLVRGAR